MAPDHGFEPVACPHCGGKTRLQEDASLHWVCGACGGPRIPSAVAGVATDGPEFGALRETNRARMEGARARATALALTPVALLNALLALALIGGLGGGFGWTVGLTLMLVAAVSGMAVARSRRKAREALATMTENLYQAWSLVLVSILKALGRDAPLEELAKALHLPPSEADRLLAWLAARDRVRVEVGDDATVRYGAGQDFAEDLPAEQAPTGPSKSGVAR